MNVNNLILTRVERSDSYAVLCCLPYRSKFFCWYSMTYKAMEQITNWEASSRLPNEEIPCLLLNLKTYCRVHNDLPIYLIVRQLNPVHNFPVYIFEIHINILLSYTPIPKPFLLSRFPTKEYIHISTFPHISTSCFNLYSNDMWKLQLMKLPTR